MAKRKNGIFLNRTGIVLCLFLLFTIAGALGRVVFYVIYCGFIAAGGDTSFLGMLFHGLQLDIAVAGYFVVVPLLLVLISTWVIDKRAFRWLQVPWRIYVVVSSMAFTLAFVCNWVLYKFWGFPLDSMPLSYFMSSPKDALASATIWQLLMGVIGICVVYLIIYKSLMMVRFWPKKEVKVSRRQKSITSLGIILMGGLVFLAIRGGLSVATNNVGSVYFSENIRLNHAAVNPVFSFLESVAHDSDFASQYRFMTDEEAERLFKPLTCTSLRPANRYNIPDAPGTRVVMVILESFSKYIMTEGSHVKGVTPNLDKLAKEGLYFTNFYANSFRTDRGLMAILSGYPAQPTMSLMKYPRLTNDLYSIARTLGNDGFETQFLYGGDIDFTHMRSYLRGTGFETIISSSDFDKKELTGKWGANDELLFNKALKTIDDTRTNDNKTFTVLLTLSSHEPFDVPYHELDNERLNAFQYTDRELGRFVDSLKQRDDWKNTLLILVPDHLGCYPEDINHYLPERYQIPLIMTGGLVKRRERISTYASQQDIAATLLAMLGLSHEEFTFSKDMFDANAPHFAFFTYPDAVGMVDRDNSIMTDNNSDRVLFNFGRKRSANRDKARAYLQKIYDDISVR